jgi:hypothetical protein
MVLIDIRANHVFYRIIFDQFWQSILFCKLLYPQFKVVIESNVCLNILPGSA